MCLKTDQAHAPRWLEKIPCQAEHCSIYCHLRDENQSRKKSPVQWSALIPRPHTLNCDGLPKGAQRLATSVKFFPDGSGDAESKVCSTTLGTCSYALNGPFRLETTTYGLSASGAYFRIISGTTIFKSGFQSHKVIYCKVKRALHQSFNSMPDQHFAVFYF